MIGWEERLAKVGCRITAPRRALLQTLGDATVSLSPQELLGRARCLHPTLGLVTVYRTLALLSDLGLARRVHRDDGCHGYVLTLPGHRHAIVCRGCGRCVEFVGADDVNVLLGRVKAQTGYRIDDHLLQLFGICPECQNEAN